MLEEDDVNELEVTSPEGVSTELDIGDVVEELVVVIVKIKPPAAAIDETNPCLEFKVKRLIGLPLLGQQLLLVLVPSVPVSQQKSPPCAGQLVSQFHTMGPFGPSEKLLAEGPM